MRKTIITIIAVCALQTGAQTFSSAYEGMVDKAEEDIRHSRWKEAEAHITGALRLEPGNVANFLLWSNLGTVRSHLGNYSGAIEAFSVGLAKAPRSTVLLTNRANAYIAIGKNEDALKDLDLALQTDSLLQNAMRTRGILKMNMGDFKGAETDFGALAKHYPDDAAAFEGLGDILLINSKPEEASEEYSKAFALSKEESIAVKHGLLLLETGKEDELEKLLKEAIASNPESGRLILIRGALAKRRHLASEAAADRKRALELGVDRAMAAALIP